MTPDSDYEGVLISCAVVFLAVLLTIAVIALTVAGVRGAPVPSSPPYPTHQAVLTPPS